MLAEGKFEVQGHLLAGLLAMGESCGTAMAGASRHNNAQSSEPLNVATVEKSSLFYVMETVSPITGGKHGLAKV